MAAKHHYPISLRTGPARKRTKAPKLSLQTINCCRPSSSKKEVAKAAAYYDDLTRRGEGAAKFKQGLGFSFASTDLGS
ncbi:hypothetical protein Pyn_34258 [Prunus yedoensis var. nudiflora]|uniref:Uncharacterized protein n=1 Tax=Prunus yedoensis var. nudiflora TaxID=2094558 RepID=A0A315AH48_PRUYE|nr:hypothetical protein Pyn_34258 [Prunus yedoensis var. nudiflora]